MKKLIIFDLDGTLAESKQPITSEMATHLAQLLAYTKVAVQSGASTSKHTPLCFQTKRKPPSIEIKSKHHEWGGYL